MKGLGGKGLFGAHAVNVVGLVLALGAMGAGAGCAHEPGEGEAAVRSFRYSVSWEIRDYWFPFSFEEEGDVVLPGAAHVRSHLVLDGLETESELVRADGRTFVRGDLPFIDAGMAPLGWIGGHAGANARLHEALAGLPFVVEEIDGAAARRYDLDAETFAAVAGLEVTIGDGLEAPAATLWISEARGLPVRLTAEAPVAGTATLALEVRVYDVDDPTIAIEAPVGGSVTAALASSASPAADAGGGESEGGGGDGGVVDTLVHFLSGLVGALSGGFEPDGVYIAADAAAEAAPGIAENIENVEEWREANPEDPTVGRAFREPDSKPEEKNWLYDWFWGLIE